MARRLSSYTIEELRKEKEERYHAAMLAQEDLVSARRPTPAHRRNARTAWQNYYRVKDALRDREIELQESRKRERLQDG